MSLTIGSFNIQNFSGGSEKKNVGRMAEIITSENFDILALQEILDAPAAEALRAQLGASSWACLHGSPEGNKAKAKGYAFIWNTRSIDLAVDARIWNEPGTDLTRPPLVGRFRYRGKVLQLITTQIYAADHKGTEKAREYSYLCERVMARVDRKARIDHPATYTLLLGDYNMFPEWCTECHESMSENLDVLVTENTSLKTGEGGYQWSLDHFTLDADRWSPFGPQPSRVDAPTKYYNGDFTKYREEVSDHVPIKLEVDFYG